MSREDFGRGPSGGKLAPSLDGVRELSKCELEGRLRRRRVASELVVEAFSRIMQAGHAQGLSDERARTFEQMVEGAVFAYGAKMATLLELVDTIREWVAAVAEAAAKPLE